MEPASHQEQFFMQMTNQLGQMQKEIEETQRRLRLISKKPTPTPKLPDVYNGERSRCQEFINQLDLFFAMQKDVYRTDDEKIQFAGTLLSGPASDWFFSYYPNDERLKIFTQFKEFLLHTFDEHDRALIAENKMSKLCQGKLDATEYTNQFLMLRRHLDWDDSALRFHYRRGLNKKIRNHLLHFPKPKTLEELIDNTIEIDNRIKEDEAEEPLFKVKNSKPQETHDPMEIDAISRNRTAPKGPISEQERTRRINNKLCLYCGKGGHYRSDCPEAPSNRKSGKAQGH
jgi:hypothetical protein